MSLGRFLLIFGVLSLFAGVIAKRVFHHTDVLILLHILGAITILLGLVELYGKRRDQEAQEGKGSGGDARSPGGS